jgi:hypothetical protein
MVAFPATCLSLLSITVNILKKYKPGMRDVRNKTFANDRTGKPPPHPRQKTWLTTSRSENPGPLPSQVDYEALFYKNYGEVAKEYDKDYLKKYGEDLDTTLIFVGPASAYDKQVLIR